MEVIFEKREYPTGTQYVPVQQIVPGQLYYTQQVDQYGQPYYVEKNIQFQTIPQPQYVTQTQYTPQPPPVTVTVMTNSAYDDANALHLGITITSIFFPTLLYLIGFPFCHVRMTNLVKDLGSPERLKSKLHGYVGVGWTAWVMHLAFLVSMCTWWIPSYCYYYYNTYYNWYTLSWCELPGLWVMVAFSLLQFIFTVITIALGSDLVQNMKSHAATNPSVGGSLMREEQQAYGTYGVH
eukprot:TRINITY_DN293_c0_g1_i6.p1 TRINITY_DN293_c0_g1~~TRINITY_DN293_c0_g1_i6.p1  ORF type:complete len:237 (+),score=38.20 TRINITY_DN293_c0_g1_i6:61-771(+)